MRLLKQSTAATLKVGPFVDATDGNTAETGLTISQADVRLSKNGGNMAQKNEATSATHDEIGMYDVPVDTTDTGTLGILTVNVHETGALPVKQEYMVVPANVYDSLVLGTDDLDVQVSAIDADAVSATAIATGAITASKFAASAIDATAIASNAITAAKIATGAIDADSLAGDAITAIQADLATSAALTTVDTVVDAIKVTTDKLDDTLEDDGGTYRFTANALEEGSGATSPFLLDSGTAQAGAASTITLAAGASAVDDIFRLSVISINAGTAIGQSRQIEAYDGTTKIATVVSPWDVVPDATSEYVIGPFGVDAATVTAIVEAVWAAQRSTNNTAGSFGERVLADVTHISGDSAAADTLETTIEGTTPMAANILEINSIAIDGDGDGDPFNVV